MPIDANGILKDYIGIEITEETTEDQVKDAFNEKFVPAETHNKKLIEVNKRAAHAINKSFRDVGLEVEKDEIEKVDLFELPNVYAKKYTEKIGELEANKGATEQEIAKKYDKQLESYKTKVSDFEARLSTAQSELETVKTDFATKERSRMIDGFKSQATKSIPWSDNTKEVTKLGFDALLNSKYVFDLSEEGTPIVRGKDGNLIQSKSKAGEPATYDEVISFEFENEMKDFKKVAEPKKIGKFGASTHVKEPTGNGKQPQKYSPRYLN